MFKTTSQRFLAPTLVHAAQVATPRAASSSSSLTSLNYALCSRLSDLDPHHPSAHRADSIERLHEEFAESLAEEWRALGSQARSGLSPEEQDTLRLNRTINANLSTTLEHAPRLLRAFTPDADPDVPGHAALKSESGKVFSRMVQHPTRRAQAMVYAAATRSGDHKALGILLPTPQERREVERMREQAGDRGLDLRTVVQLRDYAHFATGSFNFYRAASILKTMHATLDVALLVEDVTAPFTEAIERLWAFPDARVTGDDVHKGWVGTKALPLAPGTGFEFSRPISATVRAEGSYVLRVTPDLRSYNVHLVMRGGEGQRVKAVHFSLYNALSTVHEGEVMVLPNQRFVVKSATEEDVRDGQSLQPVTRCIAQKVGEPHVL
ncbi:hypothetical protein ACT80S_11240 [Ramlibacter sp. MAHUQ-53]|uniref:hypothetical protein n=1 Tax=unclassified Ramlibacter TaxID=2617605 RepID=UPI003636B9A2